MSYEDEFVEGGYWGMANPEGAEQKFNHDQRFDQEISRKLAVALLAIAPFAWVYLCRLVWTLGK